MNRGWTYRNQVDQSTNNWSVLDFYTRHYRHSSQAEWQQRIADGQILLDGTKTTAETRLQVGQWLTYERPPWEEPDVPLAFEILHEDQDLMVVAKPAGLPVLPGGGFLENTLLWQLQQRYPQAPPIPIHRLGRGTSGLMLLARSPSARAYLSQQMRAHQIQKIYRTLVQIPATAKQPIENHFTVNQPIGKVAHPVLGYLYAAHPQGLSAQSECQVLWQNEQTALLEVKILTGRPHQIRIHLAAAGYPLVGDPLYTVGGVPFDYSLTNDKIPVPGDCGYHLHAFHLTLNHPNGQQVSFTCPPPNKLAD